MSDAYRIGAEPTQSIIVTTGNEIEGYRIAEYLGIVRGLVVRSPERAVRVCSAVARTRRSGVSFQAAPAVSVVTLSGMKEDRPGDFEEQETPTAVATPRARRKGAVPQVVISPPTPERERSPRAR